MIEREDTSGVTVLRLSHGPVNALDLELCDEITETFAALSGEPGPVVVTGAGPSFCAGVDLKRIVDGGADHARAFLTALSRAFVAVFEHPAPTVAAVNGHAIAGGLVIAAACDHRIAGDGRAKLGLTELAVGVPFPTAAAEIVRYAFGPNVARDLVLTARLVDVEEAHRLRIVDRVVPADDLDDEALSLAGRLGRYGPDAHALAKRQMQRPANDAITARTATDDVMVADLWADPDTSDRIRIFLDSL